MKLAGLTLFTLNGYVMRESSVWMSSQIRQSDNWLPLVFQPWLYFSKYPESIVSNILFLIDTLSTLRKAAFYSHRAYTLNYICFRTHTSFVSSEGGSQLGMAVWRLAKEGDAYLPIADNTPIMQNMDG